MAEPISHVIRPLVRTHVYHPYFAADRQAETDVVTLRDADAFALRFKCSLKPRECYNRGPVRLALSPQDELLPAR